MAQSADRTVQRILASVDDNTYVVLTSDNGFHLGQNGLGRGKGTPYDTDVRVPLLVIGPGVVPGSAPEVTSPTSTSRRPSRSSPGSHRSPTAFGASLRADLRRPGAGTPQSYVFLEHTAQTLTSNDPDAAFNGASSTGSRRTPRCAAARR